LQSAKFPKLFLDENNFSAKSRLTFPDLTNRILVILIFLPFFGKFAYFTKNESYKWTCVKQLPEQCHWEISRCGLQPVAKQHIRSFKINQ
jgi:hypothetical protein